VKKVERGKGSGRNEDRLVREEHSIDHPYAHLIPKGAHTLEEIFSPTAFWLIEAELNRPDHEVTLERVAAAIEANPTQALPDAMRSFVCRTLRGQPTHPRGRKRRSSSRKSAEASAAALYPIILRMMRKENRARGVTHVERGEVPLHQQVALTVGRVTGLPDLTAERLATIISTKKKERKKPES
jgi:hypothetical protein